MYQRVPSIYVTSVWLSKHTLSLSSRKLCRAHRFAVLQLVKVTGTLISGIFRAASEAPHALPRHGFYGWHVLLGHPQRFAKGRRCPGGGDTRALGSERGGHDWPCPDAAQPPLCCFSLPPWKKGWWTTTRGELVGIRLHVNEPPPTYISAIPRWAAGRGRRAPAPRGWAGGQPRARRGPCRGTPQPRAANVFLI